MAGVRWEKKETNNLLKHVSVEKERAKKVGVRINWKRIAKQLNAEFKNDRTPKSCFWQYQRNNNNKAIKKEIPIRTPRTKDPNRFDKVDNPEEFWITAMDDEGNVIVSLVIKNVASNVSRVLTEAVSELDNIKNNN